MRWKISALIIFISLNSFSQTNKATFSFFEYTGNDPCFNQKINPKKQYYNPIIAGFYPDPSICRRGDDYFLVNSTFSYFPGIPIFHSKDLVNWKQIGHVLDRPSQLKLDGLGLSGGVYAPAIEYNEQTQTFYVINTVVGGIGNFIVKTKDPFAGWSDPIKLPEVKGIDPSIFFDDDGKGYIVNSSASPNPKWNGHTVIWMHEFDAENDKASVERQIVVDGGPDTTKHPRWLEGPHIYKVEGKYYLIAAEGGTQSGHKQVVFRSNKVKGPYISYENNPILTQLGLPADRKNKVTNVGHADMIKTQNGDWYAVFLGCRPYADEQFNTGRETFLLPVTWQDGFPVILEKGKEVPVVVKKRGLRPNGKFMTGNFTWRDDFNTSTLDKRWIMVRTPREEWWKMADGKIELDALPRSLSQLVNPAFVACRQQHLNFEAKTELNFDPKNENELAGLAYFQNDKNYLVVGKSLTDEKMVVKLVSITEGESKVLAEKELTACNGHEELIVGIVVNEGKALFYYQEKDTKRVILAQEEDISNLSTKKAKGFVGSTIGLYATSTGL